jgi:acetolactate synthase-1/2/3 large subunit
MLNDGDILVSDIIRNFFEEKGLRHVFLLSGGMMMNLLDSISKSTKIRYICNHHEQASAMAAEVYARVNNSLGLCYATSGPGATNTITGIAGAWLDSSPVFFITGQSRTSLTTRGLNMNDLRMVGNFEVNIIDIVKPITKYAKFIDNENEILFHLQKAYDLAISGRPGPVLLDIPLDIQGKKVNINNLNHYIKKSEVKPNILEEIKKLNHLIKDSKKPLFLCGNGIRIANQVDLFRKIVSAAKMPVVTTQLANDLIEYDNDFYIGKVGLRGDRAGNFAVQNADLIICIGTSLHVTTTGYEIENFAPKAKKVFVDIDIAVINKNKKILDLIFEANIKDFLFAIQDIKYEANETWISVLQKWKFKLPVINEHLVRLNTEINTYQFIDKLSTFLSKDEIIITDSGSLYYIVGQAFRVKINQRVIVSGALGAMGFALPGSIGAACANNNKTVICLIGDGSMQTNIQELQTISTYNLDCKIFVINNKGYASIRNSQASFLDGHIAAASIETGVQFPNWEIIAQAYSIPFKKIDDINFLISSFNEIFSHKGPYFIEIIIPENVNMIPAVTSVRLEVLNLVN